MRTAGVLRVGLRALRAMPECSATPRAGLQSRRARARALLKAAFDRAEGFSAPAELAQHSMRVSPLRSSARRSESGVCARPAWPGFATLAEGLGFEARLSYSAAPRHAAAVRDAGRSRPKRQRTARPSLATALARVALARRGPLTRCVRSARAKFPQVSWRGRAGRLGSRRGALRNLWPRERGGVSAGRLSHDRTAPRKGERRRGQRPARRRAMRALRAAAQPVPTLLLARAGTGSASARAINAAAWPWPAASLGGNSGFDVAMARCLPRGRP